MTYIPSFLLRAVDEARAAASNAVAVPPRVWLPPSLFDAQLGTPGVRSLVGSPGSVHAYLFDAAAAEGVTTSVLLPDGWASFHMDFWWANAGAGAGDARVRGLVNTVAVGSATETVVVTGTGTVVTAGAQHSVIKTRVQTGVTVTAGALHVVMARRNATDAADTLANDIAFLGMELTRAT